MSKEGEPQPHGWYIAKRYDNPDDALAAYQRSRDLLFEQDLDATTFRIFLNEQTFVTLIGDEPLGAGARVSLDEALAQGIAAELPADIVDTLRARRQDVVRAGFGYVELHHRPGHRIHLPDG
jgi:hypothetical protein